MTENIKINLDHEGLTWRNIVRVDKYITDIREADAMHGIMNEYFGDWRPAGTLLGVNNLSSPAARVELTMIAVKPINHWGHVLICEFPFPYTLTIMLSEALCRCHFKGGCVGGNLLGK